VGLKKTSKIGLPIACFKKKEEENKKFGIYQECHIFCFAFVTHLTCQSARDGNNFLAMGVSKMEGGHLSWSKTSLYCMLKKRANEFNMPANLPNLQHFHRSLVSKMPAKPLKSQHFQRNLVSKMPTKLVKSQHFY
jgi:hypothetical protein